MVNARRNAATAVLGSSLYAITGFNAAPNYTDRQRALRRHQLVNQGAYPRQARPRSSCGGGHQDLCAGRVQQHRLHRPAANVQIYDTTSDSWSQGAALPAARSGVATAAFNGLMYVIAGYNPVGAGHSEVYIYTRRPTHTPVGRRCLPSRAT